MNRVTSHCFALNGLPTAPSVHGVQGILDACVLFFVFAEVRRILQFFFPSSRYEKALLNVGLSGPTNFAPVISVVSQAAQSFHQVLVLVFNCNIFYHFLFTFITRATHQDYSSMASFLF